MPLTPTTDLTDALQLLADTDRAYLATGFPVEDDIYGCSAISPHRIAREIESYHAVRALAKKIDDIAIAPEEEDYFARQNLPLGISFTDALSRLSPDDMSTSILAWDYRTDIVYRTCFPFAGPPPLDEEDQDEHAEPIIHLFWDEFFNNPNPPADHPHAAALMELNEKVLDILHRAAIWSAARFLADTSAPFCLQSSLPMQSAAGRQTELSCWLFFEKAPTFMSDLFNYFGVWAYDTQDGSGLRVAGVAVGQHFCVTSESIAAEAFIARARACDAQVCDAAKHFVEKFMDESSHNPNAPFDETPNPGFATAHLYVAPEFRGQGLSKRMLDCIVDMTSNPQNIELPSTPLYQHGERPSDIFAHAPIRAFVMQVEGVAPKNATVGIFRVMLGEMDLPVDAVNVVIEQRRIKLSDHFNSMSGGAYKVTCYNPWDYPVT